jgi:hypothetical protein
MGALKLNEFSCVTILKADLDAILAQRGTKRLTGALYKANLISRRDAARMNGDKETEEKLTAELAVLTAGDQVKKEDPLAIVNARNRMANRQEVRKAETAAYEERRKQQLAGEGKVDPSARVRTAVRLVQDVRFVPCPPPRYLVWVFKTHRQQQAFVDTRTLWEPIVRAVHRGGGTDPPARSRLCAKGGCCRFQRAWQAFQRHRRHPNRP